MGIAGRRWGCATWGGVKNVRHGRCGCGGCKQTGGLRRINTNVILVLLSMFRINDYLVYSNMPKHVNMSTFRSNISALNRGCFASLHLVLSLRNSGGNYQTNDETNFDFICKYLLSSVSLNGNFHSVQNLSAKTERVATREGVRKGVTPPQWRRPPTRPPGSPPACRRRGN